MEYKVKSFAINRRVVYLFVFLFVAVPVTVGLLTWHFTSTACQENAQNIGGTDAIAGSAESTSTTPAPTTTASTSEQLEPWRNLRLPSNVIPVHYDITLYPDFYEDHGWFYGNESVELEIKAETSHVLIHHNYMNITKTVLRNKETEKEVEVKRTFMYPPNQFLVVETQSPMEAGSAYILELQFDGSLTRAIVGFYKSTYVNSVTNQTRNLAASKFQPVDARRAFPCFDEPNFKAEYTIHLVHKSEYKALSNMPKNMSEPWVYDSSLTKTSFQRSVKMSTYLVAFIVCDFEYLQTTTSYGTPVRTFATPDRVNQTEFSLRVAKESMELYRGLFNVDYPLPKQDMVAIPDFVSGAMEHWGLIGYRETNMLFDPREASPANQQRVAIVVAHEIAHMWFGNIVTMDWWDDLWLNEGFASFMEYLGANKSEPDWEMMSQIVTEDTQPVMITDAGTNSHPIVVDVQSPDQINEVFDVISYSKGAAVIRMLEAIVGKDKFFKGIETFLKEFAWSNAKTDDLWRNIGMVTAELSVKDVMDTWTRQMGLPYIDIEIDRTQNRITATQRRFLLDRSAVYNESESEYRYRWHVYLDYVSSFSTEPNNVWLNREDTVTFDIPVGSLTSANSWIKFNHKQSGYYRVNYPIFMWERFSVLLNQNPKVIADIDKTGLISDAFNLARGGYLPYKQALDMTLFLDKEYNHFPWESAYQAFVYLNRMMVTGLGYGSWREYIIQKAKPVLVNLGWDSTESHLDNLMRVNLISLVCGVGDPDCLANSTERFRNWIDKGQSVEPNLRSMIYRYGMKQGGASDWDFMWNRYIVETVPQERINLLYGMSQTSEMWLLNRFLEYAKDETMVRSQDFFTVLVYISQNPVGGTLVWDWVRENWQYLVDRFTTYSRSLGRMVTSVTSNFNNNFYLNQVNEFFEKYPDAGAGARGRQQALESITRNIAWMKSYESTITEWLNQHI